MSFQDILSNYQMENVITYENSVPASPLVSISIITFQHVNYLKNCLEGLLKQETNFNFEIVLGEDGSTDGTREISVEYAKKFPEIIRLFLHDRKNNISINGHKTGRFNFIYNLSKTRGKYIALCDGDDYWLDKNKLQRQVDFMESNPSYVIHHTLCKELYKDQLSSKQNFKFKKEAQFSDLIKNNFIVNSSVLYRKAALPNILPDWFTKVYVGDWPLFLILTRDGGKIYYDETRSVVYRKNVGIYKNYKDHLLNLKKILELKNFLLKDALFDNRRNEIKSSIRETEMNIMAAHIKKGDYLNSFPIFARLFVGNPKKVSRIFAYSLKQRLQHK